jgi:hypothetical protein
VKYLFQLAVDFVYIYLIYIFFFSNNIEANEFQQEDSESRKACPYDVGGYFM